MIYLLSKYNEDEKLWNNDSLDLFWFWISAVHFNVYVNYQIYYKKAKKAGDSLLKCEVCDYTTRFKEHLTSHMHKHAPDRNYMCQDCGQTFKWSHSLKRHQRTHAPSSDYRYTCHFCLKTFQRKDHLTIHEALHTSSESSFPCAECGKFFCYFSNNVSFWVLSLPFCSS